MTRKRAVRLRKFRNWFRRVETRRISVVHGIPRSALTVRWYPDNSFECKGICRDGSTVSVWYPRAGRKLSQTQRTD